MTYFHFSFGSYYFQLPPQVRVTEFAAPGEEKVGRTNRQLVTFDYQISLNQELGLES